MTGAARAQPLRVLVATPLGEGGQGGIDRLMDEVRRRLAARGDHHVDVSFMATRGQRHIAFSAFRMAKVLTRLAGVGGSRPDVLHVNLSSHGSTWRKLCLSRAARALGIPYVLHLHGSGFREFWQSASPRLSTAIGAMFLHAERTLVLGNVWRDFILQQVPQIHSRIRVLPNAVPAGAVAAAPRGTGEPVILFLGQIGPRKGVPQLVDALAAIADLADWRAVIAGNGAVEQTRAAIAAHGLAGRIELPGWVGPDDVRRLLARADILVLPSFEENLPMSVIEGMAHGLGIVTTPVGAVEDIITDGETGLLVPPGDTPALGRALRRLVTDRALRATLGEAARAYHRQHLDIDGYVDTLLQIWTDAALRAKA